MSRLKFASKYAGAHLLLSLLVASAAAALVFGVWYPMPYRAMLGVAAIFWLVLAVDVTCGPLLTLILSSPAKSRRERALDFTLIGLIQVAALVYGLHAVWAARPVVLAFEVDRLRLVTANEIDASTLPRAPSELRQLPWTGVLKVSTRRAKGQQEFFQSIEMGMSAGISPGMRPDWWIPWTQAQNDMASRAKPIAELLARRPADAATLQEAIRASGVPEANLRYLPLTSSKTLDWIVLLDEELNLVGYAPVDGF